VVNIILQQSENCIKKVHKNNKYFDVQEEEMMAKAKAIEAQKQIERLKIEQIRQTSMSPHEKLIQVGRLP
jgi:hypothetical protein